MREVGLRQLGALVALLMVLISSISALRCSSLRHLTYQRDDDFDSPPPLVTSITASSYYSPRGLPNPENELFAYRYPYYFNCWCSERNPPLPQNITINLAQPLVIYELLSGGYYSGGYVRAFSLEYSETSNSDVKANQLPKVFNVTGADELAVFLLPQPIVAKTLYFHVWDYNAYVLRACWTLALVGCTVSEAEVEEAQVCSSSVTPSPTPAPAPTDSPTVGEKAEAREEESSVDVAVSTSVVTILIVAVMVGVGVALCWAISHGYIFPRHKLSRERGMRERENTLKMVENDLYTLPNREKSMGSVETRGLTSSGQRLLSSDGTAETSIVVSIPSATSAQQSGVHISAEEGVEDMMDNAAYAPNQVVDAGYEPVSPQQ